jgi:phosphoribosylaminoimidazolecarboxamide formyltransferase/IMP cyclohydrolase
MRAILSVSNKGGLIEFARQLQDLKVDIYSTGGTKKSLQESDVKVHSVSELTGFPEILDGRVKTLHPAVHGGILAKRELPQHMEELAKNKIQTIDMVVVNLYPFVQTVAKPGVKLDEALENIDIGGPTMIRAAAKNFPSVIVVVDPQDYDMVIEKLRKGQVDLKERERLAQKAFQHVAMYDTAIAQYLRGDEGFPQDMTIALKRASELRYGENPHQRAALYIEQIAGQPPHGIVTAKQLHGQELSFNNFLDFESGWKATTIDFTTPTVAIIKHNNPCGLASHKDLAEAYRRALSGDPIAAYGGVVASNQPIDMATATEIDKTHYDGIIAPGYKDDALALLKRKKNIRIVSMPGQVSSTPARTLDFRHINGGFLVEDTDFTTEQEFKPKVVSKRQPTDVEMRDLIFAWKAVRHIKSNAISLAKDETLVGMGAGQPSRVISAEIALKKAGNRAKGSVMGSDAMIPFPDTVEVVAKGGITAVIQTGGSIRDEDSIATADKYNMAMLFTGIRHFRH